MGLAVNDDYCALLQDGQSGSRKGCAASVRQQSRNVLAIAISAALVVFSYTLCKSLGVLKNQKK